MSRTPRWLGDPRPALGGLVLLLAVLVAVNAGAGRMRVSWDLTAERSATLSRETLRVLGRLDRRVRITAFFARDDPGRVEAATLLARYREANRRIGWTILDPLRHPGEAQRLGAGRGSAAVETLEGPRRVEVAPLVVEIDLTSAIARLLRTRPGTACFTSGHGERDPQDTTPEGLAVAARLLRDNGYRTRTVDLLAAPAVPADCSALVVAAPTSPLGPAAEEAVRAYLRGGGRAFLLADPLAGADLSPLARDWGLRFERGLVLEGDPGSRLPGEPLAPIVRRYGANPAVRGLGPTFFPGAMAVVAGGTDRPGLSVGEVALTTRLAYLERNPGDASFDPGVDLEGPLALGAAADDSEVVGAGGPSPAVRRTRILAFGDVDFASNAFVGEAANARLWVQGVDWLAHPEPLVAAAPNLPRLRELALTEARSRYVLLLTAGVVPALFLLAGAFVWAVRRGR